MSHAEFLRAEGGEDDTARAVQHGHWSDAELTPRQRAICTVAEKLSRDPHEVGPGDWDTLRKEGFDDEACLELAHVVGVFNHLTRLADGFGLQLDPMTLAAASGGPPLRRASAAPS
jgi:uncharacterized peroxidase-related enzyme